MLSGTTTRRRIKWPLTGDTLYQNNETDWEYSRIELLKEHLRWLHQLEKIRNEEKIFKRALCCLKKRRRPSCEPLPLTNIGVVPTSDKVQDIQSWGSWDEVPTIITDGSSKPVDPIQQKIDQYREQRMASAVETPDPEENIDFFQDMTPRIVRQKKLILQKETEDNLTKSNLSLAPDPTFHSSELGVWDDSQSWEDQTEQDWDANEVLREKKRLDRERRLAEQQRRKGDKDIRGGRSMVATKIS